MRGAALALLLAATTGCSVGTAQQKGDAAAVPSTPPTISPPTDTPGSGSGTASSPACVEVRAGIRAFNAGDFAETVAHFEVALPLARAQARTEGSAQAEDLLEAVRYYAELAPEDYPEAARSSPEFVRYKAITLGQCVPVPLDELPDGDPTSPGTDT